MDIVWISLVTRTGIASFQEIYRDNRLVVWKGQWTRKQVEQLLKRFQIQVNELAEEIWGPREKDKGLLTVETTETDKNSKGKKKKSKVKVQEGDWFAFLDMKMKWQQSKLMF
eukprot:12618818-Ditylum_brightwellii.AAC.1